MSKYGPDLGQTQVQSKYQSWWWRDLVKVCGEGQEEGWFQKAITWRIGAGDKVRFWEDVWAERSNLKTAFPRLYSISLDKGRKVGEVGIWEGEEWRWRLNWRRNRFVWEDQQEEQLIRSLVNTSLNREIQDQKVWNGEEFSVKNAYECLSNYATSNDKDVFELLWLAKAVPKVLITAWRALLGRLPTKVNLSRRGVVVNDNICVLCLDKEESNQHLFMECKIAYQVWNYCLRWFGVLGAQHCNLKYHFESFHLVHMNSKQNMVWKGVWAAVVWSIWDHRNRVIFNQGKVDAEEIFQMAQLKAWFCLKYRTKSFIYAFSDWVLNPSLCLNSNH